MSDDPSIRVVSQQSDTDIAAHAAISDAASATVLLLANLMRVLRGAGRPSQIVHEAAVLVEAYQRYFDLKRHYPGEHVAYEIRNAFWHENRPSGEWSLGIDSMIKGALQTAASRLLAQRTQERSGETELIQGLAVIEAIRERNRLSR